MFMSTAMFFELNGRSLRTKAIAKRNDDGTGIKWLAFAFETK